MPLLLQHGARLWHVLEVVFAHVVGEDEDDVGFGSERLSILGPLPEIPKESSKAKATQATCKTSFLIPSTPLE